AAAVLSSSSVPIPSSPAMTLSSSSRPPRGLRALLSLPTRRSSDLCLQLGGFPYLGGFFGGVLAEFFRLEAGLFAHLRRRRLCFFAQLANLAFSGHAGFGDLSFRGCPSGTQLAL